MACRRRLSFTDKQKSEIWDRWQRGESMSSIGRGFVRSQEQVIKWRVVFTSEQPLNLLLW